MRFLIQLLPWLTGIILFVLFIALGFWQLRRADEKQYELLAYNDASSMNMTLDGPALSRLIHQDASDWNYQRVSVSGRFDPVRQFLLDNRTYKGKAGYHVLSVFVVDGYCLLVNRGWVAAPANRAEKPLLPSLPDYARLSGRLWRFPRTGLILGADGYASTGWPRVVQSVTLESLKSSLHTEAVLAGQLLLDPSSSVGFVREWQPHQRVTPDRHRGYAFQWFSMAFALVVVAVLVNRRRRSAG